MFATIDRHGTSDPIQLAKRIGFELTYKPLPTKIRAVYYKQPGIIVLNAQMPHAGQRFAVAHTLGHFVLHPSIPFMILSMEGIMNPTAPDDLAAIRFAVSLLTHCGEYHGFNSPEEYYAQLGYNKTQLHHSYNIVSQEVVC